MTTQLLIQGIIYNRKKERKDKVKKSLNAQQLKLVK